MLNTLGLLLILPLPFIILLIVYYAAGKEAVGITVLVFIGIALVYGLIVIITSFRSRTINY